MSTFDKLNRFATNPVYMDMKRSCFDLSHDYKTTFNSGKIIPILCEEVLPDDTFKLSVASVVRSITPAVPVMDNAFIDFFAFWVPARLTTVHEKDWQKIHGENDAGFWAPSTESTLSNTGNTFSISSSSYAVGVQSLAQYLGFPVGFYHTTQNFSRLKFNGYWAIFNEWFRDQNTQAPIDWKSFTNTNFITAACSADSSANSKLMTANKMHDYFTSVLPGLQKGSSVLLPMAGYAPVITRDTLAFGYQNTYPKLSFVANTSSGVLSGNTAYQLGITNSTSSASNSGTLGYRIDSTFSNSNISTNKILPNNLWADLTAATTATINDLRTGFAIQRMLEKDARGGTRYREMLKVHFNVSIPDNTVQVPEYLGGKRVPLNMLQVLQTSETSSTSPLGSTGAFSNTADNSYLFTKSFAEYGFIYVLAVVRNSQSYSQGIPRDFLRNRRYDFYYPVFANLGEMAVKKTELYATNASNFDADTNVFGYQECWAEYRYRPNRITGYLAAGSGDTVMQKWTYQNHFSAAPTLNSSFMLSDRSQMDNTLVITNSNYQFYADFHFDIKAWRPMPYFSIPGLIDHH